MGYRNILVAIELNPKEDEILISRAKLLAQLEPHAKISLLNVVEFMDSYAMVTGVSDLDQVIVDYAQKEMSKLCLRFDLAEKNCIIRIGSAKDVILEQAQSEHYDLIVVGSHGRNNLGLLLGSATDKLLAIGPCDVLSVSV